MKLKILVGAAALVLVAAMMSAATASSHHRRHGHHVVASYRDRDAGPSYGGRSYSLGPLGFTSAAPGSYSGYGAPISAWSR